MGNESIQNLIYPRRIPGIRDLIIPLSDGCGAKRIADAADNELESLIAGIRAVGELMRMAYGSDLYDADVVKDAAALVADLADHVDVIRDLQKDAVYKVSQAARA